MKAIVVTKNGSPNGLALREMTKPAPAAGEVLIRVHAATVTAGDVVLLNMPSLMWLPMRLMGIKKKETPGHELAGTIEVSGDGVTRFKAGDRVFGTTTGLSAGANAEYVCLPESWDKGVLALLPDNVPYEQAAAVPIGAMTALRFLRDGSVQADQDVLINGASGSVGSYAVQLACHFGAAVTGVCSTSNVSLVKSLGAARVIDYTAEDVAARPERYDVVFDAVGKLPEKQAQAILKDGGRFVTVRASAAQEQVSDLEYLGQLVAAGDIRAVIDRRFPLEQTVDAYRYVAKGRKKGNVVIIVANGRDA